MSVIIYQIFCFWRAGWACSRFDVSSTALTNDHTVKRHAHTHTQSENWIDLTRAHAHVRGRTALHWKRWQPVHRGGVVSPSSGRPVELSEIAALLTVPIKETGGRRHGRPSYLTACPDSAFRPECSKCTGIARPSGHLQVAQPRFQVLLFIYSWLVYGGSPNVLRLVQIGQSRIVGIEGTHPLCPRMHAPLFTTVYSRA